MPQQTIFLEEQVGDSRVSVVKTYDSTLAREAFDGMDDDALLQLVKTMQSDGEYDASSVKELRENADSIWDDLQTNAREDWNSFSYFIVEERSKGQSSFLFVAPDWPSAETFAKQRAVAIR
jgi:hypothetical protein